MPKYAHPNTHTHSDMQHTLNLKNYGIKVFKLHETKMLIVLPRKLLLVSFKYNVLVLVFAFPIRSSPKLFHDMNNIELDTIEILLYEFIIVYYVCWFVRIRFDKRCENVVYFVLDICGISVSVSMYVCVCKA